MIVVCKDWSPEGKKKKAKTQGQPASSEALQINLASFLLKQPYLSLVNMEKITVLNAKDKSRDRRLYLLLY